MDLNTTQPPASSALVAQARALLVGQPKKIRGPAHPITGQCQQFRCYEIHCLGALNPSRWTGDEPIWGPGAPGMLLAEWNFHAHRYDRVWGSFPMPPNEPSLVVDLSEALEPC